MPYFSPFNNTLQNIFNSKKYIHCYSEPKISKLYVQQTHGHSYNNRSIYSERKLSSYNKKGRVCNKIIQNSKLSDIKVRFCNQSSIYQSESKLNQSRNQDTSISKSQRLKKRMKQYFETGQIAERNIKVFQQKRSNGQKKMSRFEKIMKIKVQKPKVCSSLKNYTPVKRNITIKNQKSEKQNSWRVEMLECSKSFEKRKLLEQKQNRLWKNFERERQHRYFQKIKKEKKKYENERRIQKRFEKAIEKQLIRIHQKNQLQNRIQHGFSHYLYPSY